MSIDGTIYFTSRRFGETAIMVTKTFTAKKPDGTWTPSSISPYINTPTNEGLFIEYLVNRFLYRDDNGEIFIPDTMNGEWMALCHLDLTSTPSIGNTRVYDGRRKHVVLCE